MNEVQAAARGMKPAHICVVIGRTRHKMILNEIEEAVKRGARMLEIRLDFLAKAPDFNRLLANKPCAMVATVRRPQDGGRWSGSEKERRMLLRQAVVAGFDWIDVEADVAADIPRFKNVKRIVSYHNLRETPADLEKLYEAMCKLDADVLKIAVQALQPADNLRVLNLLKKATRPTVAFCLGEMGVPSRVLSAKYGAPFTYAAFNKERGVAPGIPAFDELKHVFFYERVNAETHVLGVIGDPVSHSLSPLIHNNTMRGVGLNGVYLPFCVPRGMLGGFLNDFNQVPVRGYSVTIPHKEAAAALAQTRDTAVTLTRAANTLLRLKDGGWAAYNTDYQAVIDSLKAHLPTTQEVGPTSLKDRLVLVLGAGGIARSVAFALHSEGARVVVTNRTPERAEQLAHDVGCRVVDWAGRHGVVCDVLVNCTSVGMHPNLDDSPIHKSFLRPGLMVFDTVYTPENTLLVKEAHSRGCHVLPGVDMFVRQAALQFRLFTGKEPPLERMRTLVKDALSPLHWRGES